MVGIIFMKFNTGEFNFQETESTDLNGRPHGRES
jgi:hypothetical protein